MVLHSLHTRAGDEAEGVVAGLHVLPEVDVGVIEDVARLVEVVEALRAEHHAHVVAAVHHGHESQEHVRVGHLRQHAVCEVSKRVVVLRCDDYL